MSGNAWKGSSLRSVVLLSRRHRVYASAAEWNLPDVELFLFDSPSEALARISVGKTALFLFDTRDYPRYRHVLRKFLSMKTDADLVLVGHGDFLSEVTTIDREPGRTFARFRLSTAGNLGVRGPANDGEVEDYAIDLYQQTPTNLVITNLTVITSNDLATVEWMSQTCIAYQVQSTTNLTVSNSWVDVGGQVFGPANWQTNSAAPTNQFYRVVAPGTP